MSYVVAAFYQFAPFVDPDALRPALRAVCEKGEVKGMILVAKEGINGTLAGPRAGIDAALAHIRALPGCAGLEVKESFSESQPFLRLRVRLKKEIVTLGAGDVDPRGAVGHYVPPEDWNDLIARDDVAVIDTRNDYEVALGTFEGAIDPQTESFRDFPAWWEENKHRFHNKKIAMFCTGGIRCEKSTSWLLGRGVKDVYHLQGGILKYLEDVPQETSRWNGECFVFDYRVSVGHGLEPGDYELCLACRRPLSVQDRTHADYAHGISCHQCIDERSDEDRARFAERQKQVMLSQKRGGRHLGS